MNVGRKMLINVWEYTLYFYISMYFLFVTGVMIPSYRLLQPLLRFPSLYTVWIVYTVTHLLLELTV